ncbi:hypothetical protein ACJZ2D_011524 [Fusarium nematophilum]
MSTLNRHQLTVPLMQTCQTCFIAKIRCDKTQDSEFCDRCLRLGKTCVYGPARRRRTIRRNRSGARSEARSRSGTGSQSPLGALSSTLTPDKQGGILDPFQQGVLSLETGRTLLVAFRTKMTPYFPFVVFPKDLSLEELNRDRPYVCLAALAATCHKDTTTQKELFDLFNQAVGARVSKGNFSDLDLLQGLLIHLAWAHYQPRPKRYTQHLHLATSIVSDLRMDRPRRPKLWSVDGGKDANEPDWGPDEMRALAGAYYLSSSSSVVLQKSRHFSYVPYISRCCEHLGHLNQYPTDKYLAYIIHLQTLIEKVEDMASKASTTNDAAQFFAESEQIAQQCTEIKTTLPFPLSESPPLLLQLHMLELLLSQASPRGSPFGLDRFQNNQNTLKDEAVHIDWLSGSISASRSLISIALVLPPGEEAAMSNIGWITIYCGLSLAARLDLMAARGSTSGSAQFLRRFLDMPHTLRQMILRLEAAAGPAPDDAAADRHPFDGLAQRVRRLEEWYLVHADRKADDSAALGRIQVNDDPPMAVRADNLPVGEPMPYQDLWAENSAWYLGPEVDIGRFLFTDPADFSWDFGL